MEEVLQIHKLSKRYGKIQALSNLSFTVKKGTVFGLLGPNGSGKTTALGILLGVVNKDSGDYKWFGETNAVDSRKKIGAILEGPIFYPYLNAEQNLKLIAEIKGAGEDRMETVLQLVQLYERRFDPFKTYSLGMKQRLSIAAALLTDPEVLILDEPTNGLDPQGIADIRALIAQIAEAGKTIILASHLLDEVQKVCSDFVILRKGKLIHQGKVNDINDQYIELACEDTVLLEKTLQQMPAIASYKKNGKLWEVKHTALLSIEDFHKQLIQEGVVLSHLRVVYKDLEKEFLDILADKE